MPEARETWTDERLDDLSHRVDDGFLRVDRRIGELSADMNSRFAEVNGRIDALQRTMIQLSATTTVGILATLVSVILTRA